MAISENDKFLRKIFRNTRENSDAHIESAESSPQLLEPTNVVADEFKQPVHVAPWMFVENSLEHTGINSLSTEMESQAKKRKVRHCFQC